MLAVVAAEGAVTVAGPVGGSVVLAVVAAGGAVTVARWVEGASC